ncbi:MAG: DrmB family protein, partial [Rhabdochlamydiaceae bacterium]
MPYDKIKHGRSKHISNYGGVGSLIETTDNSIIIETFDEWGYSDLNEKLAHYIIKDDRLLQRLKNRFPNLKHLVAIPTDRDSFLHQVRPKANYFPKWFYCARCNRFANYNEWKKRWTASGKKTDFFNPPKCSNNECKENHLEQIRFVMTCSNGHIHDLPWEFWNNRLPKDRSQLNDEENDNKNEKLNGPQLDFSKKCCKNQDLRYDVSRENTELSGIWIKCNNCKKRANFKGIFNYEQVCPGKKYWLKPDNGKFNEENCTAQTSVKLKTSNSVYYANSLSSLFIPELQNPLSTEIRIDIDNMIESGQFSTEQVVQLVSIQKKIDKELIQQYLETGDIKYIPDNIYREAEYKYFLEKEQPDSNQIKFRVIDCSEQINGFSKLVKIDKLKKTTVQTSFTRNEPIDVDSILQNQNEYEYSVQRQSVSKNNFDTKTLPALESYGEGILFVLDKQKLEQWEQQKEVNERTEKIKSNAQNADWKSHQIIAKSLTPRKLLIHTLSHLIIRELEYVCGYPASSLSERLYVSETMYGFLISAFDGTDGYLGGLSNLCNDLESLKNIINSAILRASDCSSDPICIESEGQGVGQLNLAACHSCTLTPETSCELSNLYLDRNLI